ncbi:MAG: hypothetical protein OXC46_04350 [Thaumarchaeota archaeon]|nr:hypothetical protein [Nitrososphaerota archaeon]
MKDVKGPGRPKPHNRKTLSVSKTSHNIKISHTDGLDSLYNLPAGINTALAYYCDTCNASNFRYRGSKYFSCLEKGHTVTAVKPTPKQAGRI